MSEYPLPPMRLVTCDTARREPGLILFNIRPAGIQRDTLKAGWIIGIDRAGETALNWTFDAPTQDVRLHPNGNIFFTQPGAGMVTEIDRTGQVLRRWHAAGKYAGKTPPQGSCPIDIGRIHHTIDFMPDGNLLLLSNELRHFEGWPGSDTDPAAPTENAEVIGDIIAEVDLDGRVVAQWHMLDLLDPYRICYGSRRTTAVNREWPKSNDWAHANCARHDARDDSILVSLRTQDCIAKLDRASGALKWILGSPKNWRSPWAEKLLAPKGDIDWQYHQHDCSVTPSGTVMCFDNGNHRAVPFDPKVPDADCYSRAVEFAVDEVAGTVEQVWSYGEAPDDRLFACFQGGAKRLPETGNTLITYGGVATIDGAPTGDNDTGFGRARLVEVTQGGDVVFDLWIDASGETDPVSYSVFRAEHLAD
jgi:hypothetical protein